MILNQLGNIETDSLSIHLNGDNDSSISANILFPLGITIDTPIYPSQAIKISVPAPSLGSFEAYLGTLEIFKQGDASAYGSIGLIRYDIGELIEELRVHAYSKLNQNGLGVGIYAADALATGYSGGVIYNQAGNGIGNGSGGTFSVKAGDHFNVGSGVAGDIILTPGYDFAGSAHGVVKIFDSNSSTYWTLVDNLGNTYTQQLQTSGTTTIQTFTGILKGTSGVVATASSSDLITAIGDADDDATTKGVSTYVDNDFNVTTGVVSINQAGTFSWSGTHLHSNNLTLADSSTGTGPYLNIGDNSQAGGYVSIQNDQFNTGNILFEPQSGFGGDIYLDGGLSLVVEGNLTAATGVTNYGKFGPTLTSPQATLSGDVHGIFVTKQESSTTGAIAGVFEAEYANSSGASSAAIQALNVFSHTIAGTTSNLTATTQGGGLRSRAVTRQRGTGTIAQMSNYSLNLVMDASTGTVALGTPLNVEAPTIGAAATMTEFRGINFETAAVSGTVTTAKFLHIPALTFGSSAYEVWLDGDAGLFFREASQQIYSSTSKALDLDSSNTINFRINTAIEASLTSNTLTFNNGVSDTSLGWSSSGVLAITATSLTNSGTLTSSGNITISKATPAFFLTDSGGDDYTIDVGSTASLLRIRNTTDSTNAFQVDGSGNVAVSTSYAPQTTAKFYAQDRTASASATARAAFTATQEVVISGAFTGGNQRGFLGGVSFISNQNSVAGAAMIGLEGGVTVQSTAGFTQTALNGLFGTLNFTGGSTITLSRAVSTFVSLGTGSVATSLSHIAVGSTQTSGGASITNLYGFYTDAITAGTNNYEGWMGTDAGWFFREDGNQINSRAAATLDLDATTTMNFRIGGGIEAVLTANRLTTNNGVSDTYLDWSTTGQLDVGGGIFRVTGTAVIQATAFTPYASGYELSVQSNNTATYVEILANTGSGLGSFFGTEVIGASNVYFSLYNWEGNAVGSGNFPIVFWGGFGSIELARFDRTGGTVFNDTGEDVDFRIEGDTLTHAIFLDASAATENIALVTTAAPNWQSMDRGLFIGEASTVPTGNPTAGGFLYAEAGALKWRGTSGTITTMAPA